MRLATFFLSFVMFATALLAVSPVRAEDIAVGLDTSRLFRLDRSVRTLVVGNPEIAEVTSEHDRLLILHGRSLGVTNLIALDVEGEEIIELDIHVSVPQEDYLFLHNGATSTGVYNCRGARCIPAAEGAGIEAALESAAAKASEDERE